MGDFVTDATKLIKGHTNPSKEKVLATKHLLGNKPKIRHIGCEDSTDIIHQRREDRCRG